jgi:hypothetical protein
MAKTAAQATQKWVQNAGQAQQTWLTNLQNTSKPITAAAIAQSSVAVANYADSINSGRWASALSAVGDAGVKSAAAAKAGNYTTGINAAGDKFGAFMQKLIAYEQAGLPQIYAMPKGNVGAGKARANAWIDYMAAGKGNF